MRMPKSWSLTPKLISILPVMILSSCTVHQTVNTQKRVEMEIEIEETVDGVKDWENPRMFGRNKAPAHCTLMPYANVSQALAGERHKSPFYKSLNSNWKFHWVGNPGERPHDFYRLDYDVSDWAQIPVPSIWQLQGYGMPIYLTRNYPFAFDNPNPPYIPHDNNPFGSYRREFTVPDEWEDREVFIHFDGVKSNCYVWVNGLRVGYSQGSMTPAEFNITALLHKDSNVLAVEVYR